MKCSYCYSFHLICQGRWNRSGRSGGHRINVHTNLTFTVTLLRSYDGHCSYSSEVAACMVLPGNYHRLISSNSSRTQIVHTICPEILAGIIFVGFVTFPLLLKIGGFKFGSRIIQGNQNRHGQNVWRILIWRTGRSSAKPPN